MRSLALVLLVAACGGGAKPASTLPANDAPEPLRKEGDGAAALPPPPVDEKQLCENQPEEFGPVLLSADVAGTRHGLGAKKYADAPSAKTTPIEVCGIAGSRKWLIDTRCADGSAAYANAIAVAQSRAGNVGPGGRCRSIIDHYVAKCPEAAYDVYIDMYMCGPDETFQ